jgi:hypothetical protein
VYMTNSLTLQLGVPGVGVEAFGSISWQADKRFRLAPLTYVDVAASVEESLYRDLPDDFLFSLDRLHSFDYLPMGHHQVFGSVALALPPIVRDSGYAVFNLARLDSVVPSLFIQGGWTKSNCAFACEAGILVEAGAKMSFSFVGFLGSSITVGVGYAQPLVGTDGSGRLFIDLSGLP